MSKADKDGWIRHRGGKCPVHKATLVDVRYRNAEPGVAGFSPCGKSADYYHWDHVCRKGDIMAYRMHKPTERVTPAMPPEGYGEVVTATLSAVDGPLQWRDRIAEIDATTMELTTERAELVQKLAGEGFALIGRINELLTEAAQKHEDVDDPKNWKVGDELKAIGNCGGFSFAGEVVKILVVRDDGGFEVATESEPDYGWFFTEEESITDLKFHSRPSA